MNQKLQKIIIVVSIILIALSSYSIFIMSSSNQINKNAKNTSMTSLWFGIFGSILFLVGRILEKNTIEPWHVIVSGSGVLLVILAPILNFSSIFSIQMDNKMKALLSVVLVIQVILLLIVYIACTENMGWNLN